MRAVVTAWVGYIAAAAVCTYFAVLLPLYPSPLRERTWRMLVDHWDRWDASQFYLPIAQHGYATPVEASFFPLYPLLVHGLWIVTGEHHLVADALTISMFSLLAALFGLAALARQLHVPTPLVLLLTLTASPVAFFLLAPYPTSLLLALVVWTLYFAGKTDWPYHWYVAAGLAFFAPLVHPTGVVLAPVLIIEAKVWQRVQLAILCKRLTLVLEAFVAVFSVPVGLGVWCAYCSLRYHDALAWLHAQQYYFGHVPMWPWQAIGLLWGDSQKIPSPSYNQARLLVDLLPLVFSLAVFVWALVDRRHNMSPSIPASWCVLWGLLLYLTIASPVVGTHVVDPIVSAGRYLLPAVPSTLFLANKAKEPRIQTWLSFLLTIGVVLQVVTLSIYLNGGWIV